MWANAQRDGSPAEYRWRPLPTPQSLTDSPTRVPCNNAVNIGERKTWTQSEFYSWQNSLTGQETQKVNICCTSPGDGQWSCKVWLASVERRRCSKAATTRNPLKFTGVPQTTEPISAACRLKFTILWEHVWETLLFNKFFSDCRYMPYLRRYSPTKLCDGAQMANFWRFFCVLYSQRAACSTFLTCILNSHQGHTMCGSMADIESATAEIRQGKKEDRRNHRAKI